MQTFRFIFDWLIHSVTAPFGPEPDQFLPGFSSHVLRDSTDCSDFNLIENIRSGLVRDSTLLSDFSLGAGSRNRQRTVGDAIRDSSVSARYGRLLYRLAAWHKPSQVIELGTAAGISTLYLASGCRDAEVITVEGHPQLASLAEDNLRKSGLNKVTVLNIPFEAAIPYLSGKLAPDALVFIDGNHTREATLKYFSTFAGHPGMNPILIMDDINWSPGMRSAWQQIHKKTGTGVFMDLFFMGIYFSNSLSPAQFIRVTY